METTEFKDRVSTHPGRKQLTIISQTADTMVVDEVFADEPTEEGTAINADVMTKFQQGIVDANNKSDEAVRIANQANGTASSANTKSQTALSNSATALSNSQQAVTDSSFARAKALEVEGKLADRGATIRVNGTTVTSVDFTSDPQTQLNNQNTEIINIKNNTTNIANNNGGFSCGSGATNGSGLQFKGFTLCDANGKIPVARLVDAIYPVGSIYMSTGSTSPASLFGGTWEQLKDRFLLGGGGSYALGATDGEANHTLTTNEMPSHRHGLSSTNAGSWCDDYDWVKPLGNNGGGGANKSGAVAEMCINTGMGQRYVESYDASYSGHIMQAIGGGSAHNNMPPYLVVNMWKRVS